MQGARSDLVGVIEAAYRLEGDDGTWLARIVDRAARAGLDQGLGTCGMFYELDGERVHVHSPVARDTPPGGIEALRALEVEAPSELVAHFIKEATAAVSGRATCSTMSGRLRMGRRVQELEVHQRFLAPLGIVDFLSVAATDPNGRGCLVGAPLSRVSGVRRGEASAWSRVAAHMAAGMRLRRGKHPTTEDADAVLSVTGKLEHAVDPPPAMIEALENAAKGMQRARGSARRTDPPAALEAWKALVSGQWSLLDHFDHDGKRYIVAVRNEPGLPEHASDLSPREAQVVAYAAQGHGNKLIAYELGIAPSTVAMHLSTAALKLGARSRVELIRAWNARVAGVKRAAE